MTEWPFGFEHLEQVGRLRFGRPASERPDDFDRRLRRDPMLIPRKKRLADIWCLEHRRNRPPLLAVVLIDALVTTSEDVPFPGASHPVEARCPECSLRLRPWHIDVRKVRELLAASDERPYFIDVRRVALPWSLPEAPLPS